MDFSQDRAYAAYIDGTVRIWDLNSGECSYTLKCHEQSIGQILITPLSVVSCDNRGTLCIWDPDTGEIYFQEPELFLRPYCVFLDGIVMRSKGGITVRDQASGKLLKNLSVENIDGFVVNILSVGRFCVALLSDENGNHSVEAWEFPEGGMSENRSYPEASENIGIKTS